MSAQIIDGKAVAASVRENVATKIADRKAAGKTTPTLAVILVGQDPASEVYVRNKKNACAKVGIDSRAYDLEASTTQEELHELIATLNGDESVHGILLQLPLPDH